MLVPFTCRKRRLSCSHISELICSRTCRAFSRADAIQDTMDEVRLSSKVSACVTLYASTFPSGGGVRKLCRSRCQRRLESAPASASIWVNWTSIRRALCSACSKQLLIQYGLSATRENMLLPHCLTAAVGPTRTQVC